MWSSRIRRPSPQLKAGRIQALAHRCEACPLLPDVPTMVEAGQRMDLAPAYVVFLPRRQPAAIVSRVHRISARHWLIPRSGNWQEWALAGRPDAGRVQGVRSASDQAPAELLRLAGIEPNRAEMAAVFRLRSIITARQGKTYDKRACRGLVTRGGAMNHASQRILTATA